MKLDDKAPAMAIAMHAASPRLSMREIEEEYAGNGHRDRSWRDVSRIRIGDARLKGIAGGIDLIGEAASVMILPVGAHVAGRPRNLSNETVACWA